MFHIFRAYHALPQKLVSSKGIPTNALLGLVGILRHLWRSEQVGYCVAVFESATPTFRHELDEQYKANRAKTPDALKAQIPIAMQLLQHLGVKVISVEGFEADDVLGTLACRCAAQGVAASIVSNDKDLAQVITKGSDNELLRVSKKGASLCFDHIDAAQITDLYGVEAELIPSWLALTGDSSDNITGVKGIGPRTAADLLHKSGSLQALLDNPEQAGRFCEVLQTERDRILQNLDMVTIDTNVPLPFEGLPLEQFAAGPFSLQARDFIADLELKSLLKQMDENILLADTLSQLWC